MDEKIKILLAEDDTNLGMLLKEYLRAKGFDTVLCEAVLRRSTGLKPEDEQEIFKIGKLTFNSKKQTLFDGEEEQKLTTKESELLRLLCLNVNKVLERNYALKNIWADDNYFNARSMDVYITKLRKHLKKDPSVEIINVHGKGYKLIL